MPWLAATAFLHSVMVQERKGMLKVWNMVLVALAFELSVFGTFLTRSGVVNSIHSFAQSSIGAWFLAFVVISSLFSVALILWRLPLLKARTKLESALSREATFLYNNLLLVALSLTILWGVLFPILTQLVEGRVAHDRPAVLRLLPARVRAAAAVADGHRPADRLAAHERARARACARLAARRRGRRGRRAGRGRRGLVDAGPDRLHVLRLRARNDRGRADPRHAGRRLAVPARLAEPPALRRLRRARAVVLLAIGIAGSSAYGSTTERKLVVGQSMHVPGYTLTLRNLTVRDTSNATETRAILGVSGRWSGTISSGANQYRNPPEPSNEVGIKTNWLRGEDLYVIANDFKPKQHAVYVKVLVKPLVNLIWIAGIVFLLGSAVAIWPDAREQRRLVTRLAPARVTGLALAAGVALAAIAVLLVALPFLREPVTE